MCDCCRASAFMYSSPFAFSIPSSVTEYQAYSSLPMFILPFHFGEEQIFVAAGCLGLRHQTWY